MELNKDFADQVGNIADKNAKLFFLCKVGGRSTDAAIRMTEKGYKNCYNISGGFEGFQHSQGKVSGWKEKGLPWKVGSY